MDLIEIAVTQKNIGKVSDSKAERLQNENLYKTLQYGGE